MNYSLVLMRRILRLRSKKGCNALFYFRLNQTWNIPVFTIELADHQICHFLSCLTVNCGMDL